MEYSSKDLSGCLVVVLSIFRAGHACLVQEFLNHMELIRNSRDALFHVWHCWCYTLRRSSSEWK